MSLTVTEDERAALEAGQNQSRRVRHWRRYRAVLWRADSVPVTEVARALGGSEASVYTWTAAWRRDGAAGVAEGKHPGQAHRRDEAAEGTVEALLVEGDPQAHAAPPRLALEAAHVRLWAAGPGGRRAKKPAWSTSPPPWRRGGRAGSAGRRPGARSPRG